MDLMINKFYIIGHHLYMKGIHGNIYEAYIWKLAHFWKMDRVEKKKSTYKHMLIFLALSQKNSIKIIIYAVG